MKSAVLTILPLLAAANKVTIKQIEQPFHDDPSITILSPEHSHKTPRHLQDANKNSNDATLVGDLTQSQVLREKQCADSQALWSLNLRTDSNPGETKWTLKQVSTNELMIEGPPSNQEYISNTAYDGEICILRGLKYIFRILDSGEDGMCCDSGNGGFTMSVDGKVFVDRQGRDEDWSKKSFLFHVGNLTETARPTPRPSRRPTPKPTVWEVPSVPLVSPQPTEQEMIMLTPQPMESAVSTPNPTEAVITPAPVPETDSPTAKPEEGVAVSFILMGDGES